MSVYCGQVVLCRLPGEKRQKLEGTVVLQLREEIKEEGRTNLEEASLKSESSG